MKKLIVLLGIALVGLMAWTAAGPNKGTDSVPMAGPRAMGAAPPLNRKTAPASAERFDTPARSTPAVPVDLIAPIPAVSTPVAGTNDAVAQDPDVPPPMIIPVAGVDRSALRDMFNEVRGDRRHEAIDIMAPRGTPVLAADDGSVKKLFTSVPGGLTVYEFDRDQRFCYYYAHLDRYAAGLHEGQLLHRGEILGYVGTTGNAPQNAPHLHFALIRLDSDRRWWKGTPVDPYPMLAEKTFP